MVYVGGTNYLIRMKYVDNLGVEKISSSFGVEHSGNELLVEGTTKNGTYELIFDAANNIFITVTNAGNNIKNYTQDSLLYIDENGIPIFLEIPNPYQNIKNIIINDLRFLNNNLNVTSEDNMNIIFFSSPTLKKDTPMAFRIDDEVTLDSDPNSKNGIYPIHFNEVLQLFYGKFIVPRNTIMGNLNYALIFSQNTIFKNGAFEAPLTVTSTNFNNEGPIINFFFTYVLKNSIVWSVYLESFSNGVKYGLIKIMGLSDNSIYTLNINNNGSNLGPNFNITQELSTPCVSQDYKIFYMYLVDENNKESIYSKQGDNIATKNPLRTRLDNQSFLTATFVCPVPTVEPSLPVLLSFNIDRSTVDVGSTSRNVTFTFTADDVNSGMLPKQKPIVYLISKNYKPLECESNIIPTQSGPMMYSCNIELPIGYGYPNKIFASVYGFVNKGGLFMGLSTQDLLYKQMPYSISTSYSFEPILTSHEKYFSPGDLLVYGRVLKDTKLIKILLPNGELFYTTPNKIIGSSVIVFPIIRGLKDPFQIKAILNSNKESNWLTVNPIFFNYSLPTPTPPENPNKCFGSPLCGGKDHGYCSNDLGCICYSPWVGEDCLSKVIIVPKPQFNTTDPTIVIPITNNDEVQTEAFYKSLISLYGIREFNIEKRPIKTYIFNSWYYSQVDSDTGLYKTNISILLNSNVETNATISTTIKWFENQTIINFAKQNLIMYPSSIKYTVQVENYPFESRFNSLELIMYTSFESSKDKDLCSSKEFSESQSSNSDFLKIQIENKSFYGRFIKRAIIDNGNIVPLSNTLLDMSLNTIDSPNQVQTYIGISIPYFESTSIIDPDFSVLVDSDYATSSSLGSRCTINNGLSKTQIAGIVIACGAFVAISLIAVLYVLYKKKKNKLFMINIGNKLKNFENEN
ncbi:hypothetical protein DICPUDRAFT_146955 [Dictyostelium purpureum]|uniref:EGF-like domain-containing protein n=1 Tax=Dictyostelium purpureum TaxID=5786 RepID=F0Z7A3_DICPU|nr:uncharacterized protein DICPUDRAFT_146955 [Dictyostelium purpureum]EGC40141.1 hypothetical protein DICPUDRAFT_146955 [Dictyostelium purpureum]|eukprot:XP_003283331.1 hypothetical protein DICPUDRAFT_146955 [Dictyostelium purpureum]